MPRLYVIDVPCSECRVGTGEQCVRSNGRPFSRVTGGMFEEPAPGLIPEVFTRGDGSVVATYYTRPYQYHQPRRLLYNTVKAQMLLGLTASA
jgi:hypothetical protein